MSGRPGVDVYIVLGLHVQPELQKCDPNVCKCNSNLGGHHLLAPDGPPSVLESDLLPKKDFCRP